MSSSTAVAKPPASKRPHPLDSSTITPRPLAAPPAFTWGDDADSAPSIMEVVFDDVNMSELREALPDVSDYVSKIWATISPLNDDDLAIPVRDVIEMAGLLTATMGFKGIISGFNVVVDRRLLALEDDALELHQLLERTYRGAAIPRHKTSASLIFFHTLVSRNQSGKGGTLLGSKDIMHCMLQNRSFGWLSPLGTVWPPPIICGMEVGSGFLWSFKLTLMKGFGEETLLAKVVGPLQEHFTGFMFRALDKDGVPLVYTWYLRLIQRSGDPLPDGKLVTQWLEEVPCIDPKSVWLSETCVFCWQNPIYAKGGKTHSVKACPLASTFNKVRKSASLTLITCTSEGFSASLIKAAVKPETVVKEVDAWKKEVQGMLAAHDKRLASLEKKAGLKHKADDTDKSSQPPNKKEKKGKKKQQVGGGGAGAKASDSSPQQPKLSSSGSGKGKGGSKAKRCHIVDDCESMPDQDAPGY
ncbi:hypothetical protein EI94DRAFT_1708404 [Lactarius quietus]|nr:hypothetical protein EI94DRAFT_1708404 [Lactarius quietus]